MANGTTHRICAAVAVGAIWSHADNRNQQTTMRPILGAMLATGSTNLPDLIEPAIHPNHRQFFHSIAFAGILGWGALKIYNWEPELPIDKAMRFVLLTCTAGYLIHLALDALTAKSLPLVGKF